MESYYHWIYEKGTISFFLFILFWNLYQVHIDNTTEVQYYSLTEMQIMNNDMLITSINQKLKSISFLYQRAYKWCKNIP